MPYDVLGQPLGFINKHARNGQQTKLLAYAKHLTQLLDNSVRHFYSLDLNHRRMLSDSGTDPVD